MLLFLFLRYNLLVPEDKFQETFGEKWSDVLKEGRGVNAMEACKLLLSVRYRTLVFHLLYKHLI